MTVSDDPISDYYNSHEVVLVMSFMSLVCYLAGVLGYYLSRPGMFFCEAWKLSNSAIRKVTVVGIILGLVSAISVGLLIDKSGGVSDYFLEANYYDQTFEGQVVWLLFLSRLIYPAIASFGLLAMSTRSVWHIVGLLLLSLYPLMNIVFLYRRSDIVYLLFILAYLAIGYRGLKPGRAAAVLGSIALAVTILLFPALRQEVISDGEYVNPVYEKSGALAYIESTFSVEPGSEIIASAARIERVMARGELDWGGFIWNSLVSQFLPSALVGAETKKSLMLSTASSAGQYRGASSSP